MNFNGTLDQEQTEFGQNGRNIANNNWSAQSFKPTLPTLSRVELFMWCSIQNTSIKYDIIISIKKSLTGPDLTSISIPPDCFYYYPPNWVEFDFTDIQVTPEETYFIVCRSAGNSEDYGFWGFKQNSSYIRGKQWISDDGGSNWIEKEYFDFCFRTYGVENQPPNIPIKPSGPNTGESRKSYNFLSSTTDPENDDVFYCFYWGNNEYSEWVGPYFSGEPCQIEYTWNERGNYDVKVKAKDSDNKESDWSEALNIIISPFLNNIILCDEMDGSPGPHKEEFHFDKMVYCWVHIYGCKLNDIVRWDWYSLDDMEVKKTIEKENYQGNDCTYYSYYKPYKTGNWKVIIIVNGEIIAESPVFTVIFGNKRPEKPVINGPSNGITGSTITFKASTIDPDDDKIYYYWDFGDGSFSDSWKGPYGSGEVCEVTHVYSQDSPRKKPYEVRAKACDERGYESEWSEYHEFISPLMKKNVMDTFVINMAAPRHECRSFLFTSGPIWKLQQCLMMFVQVFGP